MATSSGALGMGLGMGLGAKCAAPDRTVITTVGDGSYMFGCPTAAHFVAQSEKLPTLTMVMNNSQWFAVRRATVSMYPDGLASKANSLPIVDLSPSPDYHKITEAFGGYGERIEDPAKLIPAMERALNKVEQGQQATLNVIVRTRAPSSTRSYGLLTKSSAPASIPAMRDARSSSAVTIITGTSASRESARSRRHTS
jgi:acetolactate synthase-1/2/3 large subunit